MSTLLRIAAAVYLIWAALLFWCRPIVLGAAAGNEPVAGSVASVLAIAHVGWAFLLWRASHDPARERSILYGTLVLAALRAVSGTYQVLYVIEGPAAMANLVDMVTSLALFVGMINALPQTLRGEEAAEAARHADAPPGRGEP